MKTLILFSLLLTNIASASSIEVKWPLSQEEKEYFLRLSTGRIYAVNQVAYFRRDYSVKAIIEPAPDCSNAIGKYYFKLENGMICSSNVYTKPLLVQRKKFFQAIYESLCIDPASGEVTHFIPSTITLIPKK